MALTLNPATKVISVPQADLTLVSGTLYDMDTNTFRKDVFDLLSAENYIWMDDAFTHNTEVTVAGVTYARTLEFINGYSVQFTPNSQWTVRLTGSNNNIFDVENGVLVQNQVQVIPTNSAGLQVVTVGSGLSTDQDAIIRETHKRLDLNTADPNTYQDDNSEISNSEFTLTKTDNGDGTFTVNRS